MRSCTVDGLKDLLEHRSTEDGADSLSDGFVRLKGNWALVF